MDDLEFDFEDALAWFPHDQETPYVLVRVSEQSVAQIIADMGVPLRRCYVTDAVLDQSAARHGVSRLEIVNSKLPDAGATMAGDFGEVLGYFYQAAMELPKVAIGAKKWRLKQDRTKPAPKSDVVHFVMPRRPLASDEDGVLCSEVKLKSTAGASTPVASAIADCKKDRISRLSSTLVWLRERAMTEDLGDIDISLLDRFINTVDYPAYTKKFRAIAVICEAMLQNEVAEAPEHESPDYVLVVISIPNLQETYTAVFESARASVA